MCKGTKLVGTTWKIIRLFMQNKICGFMEIELQEKSMAKRQEKEKGVYQKQCQTNTQNIFN